jgi:peptidoglycan/LPS O-acetylase OafA/YrhL
MDLAESVRQHRERTARAPESVGDEGLKDLPVAKASLHIPSLDGLRAVSFFIVFLSHSGIFGVGKIPGGFGVTVFFFLSGYLITTLLRVEMERNHRVSFSHFYLRRALRILPPFYILLGSATALTWFGVLGGELHRPAVMAQILQYSNFWFATHRWEGVAAGTGVLWSLAVEEHFYLAFPAIFVLLHRFGIRERKMAVAFWTICALVLAWRCVLVLALHSPTDRTFIMTDTRLDSMLFGCALAVWRNPALDDAGVPPSPVWMRVWLPLSLLCLLATFAVRAESFRETVRYSLQGAALYPIFVTAIRRPDWGLYRVLNLRIVRHLGVLSYSLYLGHLVILEIAWRHVTSALVQTAVALACVLVFAEAMYHFVEKPCASLRRRFSKVG